MKKPVAYQETGGIRKLVNAGYRLKRGRAEFKLGAYDRMRPLVIDPLLDYVSYYGGPGRDYVTAITSDKAYMYFGFNGASATFGLPKFVSARPNSGNGDIAIVAIGAGNPTFVSSQTFIGGAGFEGVSALAPGPFINTVWIAGSTYSEDFPVTNGSTPAGGGDAFLSAQPSQWRAALLDLPWRQRLRPHQWAGSVERRSRRGRCNRLAKLSSHSGRD